MTGWVLIYGAVLLLLIIIRVIKQQNNHALFGHRQVNPTGKSF